MILTKLQNPIKIIGSSYSYYVPSSKMTHSLTLNKTYIILTQFDVIVHTNSTFSSTMVLVPVLQYMINGLALLIIMVFNDISYTKGPNNKIIHKIV